MFGSGLTPFVGLWLAAALGALARAITVLALSWIALELTGSPFMVGVVLAARMVPQMLFGIPVGVLADRVDRRGLLVLAALASAVLVTGLAAIAEPGVISLGACIVASLLLGTLDTVRMTATQTLAYDLVRAARATRGLAATNLGHQLSSTLGAVLGGAVIEAAGWRATLLIGVGALVGTGIFALFARAEGRRTPRGANSAGQTREAFTLLRRSPLIAVLAAAIILAEVFGFSHQTLLPTMARDIFEVGASGLGIMTSVRSVGGVMSLGLIAWLGAGGRSGWIFVVASGLLGIALVVLGLTPSYAVALVALAAVGAAAGAADTLGQTMLQRTSAEHERGAAMGIWVFSIGFAPFGHLAIGAAASALGVQTAQVASGVLLVGIMLLFALYRPLLRVQ
ncbi:MAG: MFS transporter [Chloroflexota bacterium]